MTGSMNGKTPSGPTMPLKTLNADMSGTLSLNAQEAHWIANAAGFQAQQIEEALKRDKVAIAKIRESRAMANGLRNLSAKAVHAFEELVKKEAAKQALKAAQEEELTNEEG